MITLVMLYHEGTGTGYLYINESHQSWYTTEKYDLFISLAVRYYILNIDYATALGKLWVMERIINSGISESM